MKKIYTLVLIFTLTCLYTFGQQHFVFDPTDSYEQTSPLNSYVNHKVDMINMTGGELTLAWERLYIDFPDVWEYTLCDFGGCYVGIPESGEMMAISDTLNGYLKITLNPWDHAATGTVVFRVYDTKTPMASDTLTFTIHSGDVTGLSQTAVSEGMNVYPNPANDWTTVESLSEGENVLSIINVNGQLISSESISSKDSRKIDMRDFEPGFYFFTISNSQGVIERKKVIVH